MAISISLMHPLLNFQNERLKDIGRTIVEECTWTVSGFPSWSFTKELDWEANPFDNRTWCWHLHQWSYIPPLLAYDRETQGLRGTVLGIDLAKRWVDKFVPRSEALDIAWHDHGTALRAKNLLVLLLWLKLEPVCQSAEFGETIVCLLEVLKYHTEILMDETFYSKYTNHGLDQSLILLEIAQELVEEGVKGRITNTAFLRIRDEIGHAFCFDGGHIENSPGYLVFGIKQLMYAREIIERYDIVHFDFPIHIFNNAANALAFFVRPDGTLPCVGDTTKFSVSNIFVKYKPDCFGHFMYSIRQGRVGKRPKETDLVLNDSGWAIFRSGWGGSEDFSNDFHVTFKCGYLSNYHRHDDDLSFVVYGYGEEWIIDGGLYKHNQKDPLRVNIRQPHAHSLSAPHGWRASRNIDAVGKASRIYGYSRQGSISIIEGATEMFPGFRSTRKFIYDRANSAISVTDSIIPVSDSAIEQLEGYMVNGYRTYVTRFLLPPDKVIEMDEGESAICVIGKKKILHIYADPSNVSIRVLSGHRKQRSNGSQFLLGWRSIIAGQVEATPCVEIFFSSKALQATTILKWSDKYE